MLRRHDHLQRKYGMDAPRALVSVDRGGEDVIEKHGRRAGGAVVTGARSFLRGNIPSDRKSPAAVYLGPIVGLNRI
jgi:hypothetical protein